MPLMKETHDAGMIGRIMAKPNRGIIGIEGIAPHALKIGEVFEVDCR